MKNGKFAKRGVSTKAFAMILAVVALFSVAVGGTLAWLTAETTEVKNTFSTSDIGVQLQETEATYKMVPGYDVAKDPKAWVTTGSEQAWLFVEVKESANFDDFMTYAIADGWTLLNDTTSGSDIDTATNDTYVICRKVVTANIGTQYQILADNKVCVKGEVTKAMMTADDFTQPTLTFTAYAHQLYQNATTEFEAATAWANLKPTP